MTNTLDLSKEFLGRRILVTGGSKGIGAAIAKRFIAAGARVVVAARARNEETPPEAIFVSGDIRKADGIKKIAHETIDALGGLDVLINNAGGARAFPEGSWSIPDEEWQDVFDLNLFSTVRITNALLPALRKSKNASIVNLSSIAATMPFGATSHYGAAKAALDMYSRTLATELGSSGIRVNVISPGPISTVSSDEFRKSFPGISGNAWNEWVPLGRIGKTDDIAEMVALLTSERGQWLTGVNYRVDGGMTAR